MNPEDLLRGYKLREPSPDLKARVAEAAQEEWKVQKTVYFEAGFFRVVASMAASVVILVIGNSVNDAIVGFPSVAWQKTPLQVELLEDIEIPLHPVISRSVSLSCMRHDFDVAVRMRAAWMRELAEYGTEGDLKKSSLPRQLMRYFREDEIPDQEVLS